MLVTTNPQRTLWETVLPPGYQDLPAQLASVDALLDGTQSPVFFGSALTNFGVEPFLREFVELARGERVLGLTSLRPDVIVNAAAHTAVDKAEAA